MHLMEKNVSLMMTCRCHNGYQVNCQIFMPFLIQHWQQALLQVIHAMTDAVSLPWPTVRTAWASSMHQVEEGHLSWTDSTQWAINRLSTSQVALAHTQTTTQSAPPRRPCRYFNEGSCSHEGHHGNYSHVCSYCMKQGRSSNHPEARCNTKQRQAGRQQQNSS